MRTVTIKTVAPSTQSLQKASPMMRDKMADMAITHAQREFRIWCNMTATDKGLTSVVCALYYLPQNFTIMLPRSATRSARVAEMVADSTITKQIAYYDYEGSSHGEPSFVTDALIVQGAGETLDILSAHTTARYVIESDPRAVASALLKISRAV